VLTNAAAYNIRVVNLSVGHPISEPAAQDPLVALVERAARRGIVVVVAAGNRGINPTTNTAAYGGINSPGNAPSAITVGAVNTNGTPQRSDDTVAPYSSRGPTRFDLLAKPDLVAPGNRIVSMSSPSSYLFQAFPGLQVSVAGATPAAYSRLSGTSMAAPAVAGTVALLLEANPRLSGATVKAVLQFTAQQLPNTDVLTQGAGYLNAVGAVRLAQLINPRSPSNTYWLRQSTAPEASDQFFGEVVAWNKTLIWGTTTLLGDSAYVHLQAFDDNIVWGTSVSLPSITIDAVSSYDGADNIVWGTVVQPSSLIWGANIVWGTNIVWCNNIVWGTLINPVP
jgi:serine protease AprX